MSISARELKNKFVDFFLQKGHAEIPSASLIPENDPSTLFISAGMHPLVPYLLGQPHPLGNKLVDVQKCVRTGDIDEVGDNCHHTFFEMLGNWSLGDYFKEKMIPWTYEFLTKHLHHNPDHLHVTCFAGNADSPKDMVSHDLWIQVGIPEERIHFLDDNWWGPAGATGPCGPDSEMFIDTHPELGPIDFEIGNKLGRIVEIGNDVFMEFNKQADGSFLPLSQKNVDTGYGVERNVAILNGFDDDYLTDIWWPIIEKIQELSGKKYADYLSPMRILADHLRASIFIATDGVVPNNKEAGYVLRRLIRRAIRQAKILEINSSLVEIAKAIYGNQSNLAGIYPELDQNKTKVLDILAQEEAKFSKTIDSGIREIQKLIAKKQNVTGEDAFKIYESYGFPVELIAEELGRNNLTLDQAGFDLKKQEHQKSSQTLSAGRFASGLADNSALITRYHTATHLLHAALRQVLGPEVTQAGSNNTQERLRFDYTTSTKPTPEQLKQVVEIVNQQISAKLPVSVETMSLEDAKKQGAMALFSARYPSSVTVYTIGDKSSYFSKEICTGPHVQNTQEIGFFEIFKEESLSSNVRRIYARLA